MSILTAIFTTLFVASTLAYNSDTITSISGENNQRPTASGKQVQDIPPPPTEEITIVD